MTNTTVCAERGTIMIVHFIYECLISKDTVQKPDTKHNKSSKITKRGVE